MSSRLEWFKKRYTAGHLTWSELEDALNLLEHYENQNPVLSKEKWRLTEENQRIQKEWDMCDKACKMWRTRAENLIGAVRVFVDKNFKGGSKANREDYTQMVTAADVYKLRESLEANKW
ncbi:hypothetical protein GZH47_33060 (plasmid) [Paenibacillus rhizovicinus]|uniref:Uncharacterized protein n=1 Tax=Paenibacillus rhizovicinus TaxID=2704463 RepID=A0A6C0PAX0_9BACL|nr:hypothetical protein [Paenibacillus rhizovicinus]QHW35724.1 hypothetical protein GZH47_33060 [Paenibacillus rhizovicinus]